MARALAAALVEPDVSPDGRQLLETHHDLIRNKLSQLGRRSGLPEREIEELSSWAVLKLVEDDYRMLTAWEGRSSFSTYLTVVLVNLTRDYRTHLWGKWRPSAAARRLGKEAVLLERLWGRDGLPLDEAIVRIRTEHRSPLSAAELERMAAQLSRRIERRWVDEDELRDVGCEGAVEDRVEAGERAKAAALLRRELLRAFRALPAEDRLLLKLSCRDGLTMAAISSALKRPQKSLYVARDRCLRILRRALEKAGLSARWLRERAGAGGWDFLGEEAGIWEK